MRELFRGWKRKLGVVTLLLACVSTAGWVRSFYSKDSIVTIRTPNLPDRRGYLSAGWISSEQGNIERVTSLAVGRGGKPMIGTAYRNWSVPYWSIVLPLTLVSTDLLFSKPRQTPPTPRKGTHA